MKKTWRLINKFHKKNFNKFKSISVKFTEIRVWFNSFLHLSAKIICHLHCIKVQIFVSVLYLKCQHCEILKKLKYWSKKFSKAQQNRFVTEICWRDFEKWQFKEKKYIKYHKIKNELSSLFWTKIYLLNFCSEFKSV